MLRGVANLHALEDAIPSRFGVRVVRRQMDDGIRPIEGIHPTRFDRKHVVPDSVGQGAVQFIVAKIRISMSVSR